VDTDVYSKSNGNLFTQRRLNYNTKSGKHEDMNFKFELCYPPTMMIADQGGKAQAVSPRINHGPSAIIICKAAGCILKPAIPASL
jgi:hypothetical protein